MSRLILNEKLNNYIVTRTSIINLFKEINQLHNIKIEIDFKEVKFISRSCVDEYLKQKENSSKEINELNLSKDIKEMFDIVEKQRTCKRNIETEAHHKSISLI
jgi:hypothetical protein